MSALQQANLLASRPTASSMETGAVDSALSSLCRPQPTAISASSSPRTRSSISPTRALLGRAGLRASLSPFQLESQTSSTSAPSMTRKVSPLQDEAPPPPPCSPWWLFKLHITTVMSFPPSQFACLQKVVFPILLLLSPLYFPFTSPLSLVFVIVVLVTALGFNPDGSLTAPGQVGRDARGSFSVCKA